jgi:GNAT superfamily N-acetyltransferase
MTTRLAIKSDAPIIATWLKEMWLTHGQHEPDFISHRKINNYSTKRILKYLKPCFSKTPQSYLLIAEKDGHIVGFLKADIVSIETFFIHTRVLYLDDLFILEQYRTQGIAKALLKEAEKIAKKHRIKCLKTRIYTFNTPAQNLAKKHRFHPLYSEYFKILP